MEAYIFLHDLNEGKKNHHLRGPGSKYVQLWKLILLCFLKEKRQDRWPGGGGGQQGHDPPMRF